MILRMVRFASSVSVRTESVPLVIRKDVRKPETGKHDHAFGHPGDARDQFRDGRRGCRNTGRDSESAWRIILPPICKAAEQLVAALGEVDCPLVLQQPRPLPVDQLQFLERFLPMPREVGGLLNCIPKARLLDFLDKQSSGRPCQVRREPQTFRAPLAAHDGGELKQTLSRGDGWRQRFILIYAVECASDSLVELRIADW